MDERKSDFGVSVAVLEGSGTSLSTGVKEAFPMVSSRQVDCKNWFLCEIARKLQGF